MQQTNKENQNEERYITTREIVDYDILSYFRSEVQYIVEDLVELKNLAYYANKEDFENYRDRCVSLLNSFAEVLQQGSKDLEELT